MSRYSVTAEKERKLLERMVELEIDEEEIVEKFIKGSGSGGQKINKTASCVYLLHVPSGIEIKCQQTRSQALNRYHARQLLCDRIEEILKGKASKRQQENEKIRRQKRRRSRRQKQRMLDEKKKVAVKKQGRRKVNPKEE